MFAKLSDLDLQEFMSSELQDDLFTGLSDSDLQDFPTRESQNVTEIENMQPFNAMNSSPQPQLLTTEQRIAKQV